jgi:hypothetical protein
LEGVLFELLSSYLRGLSNDTRGRKMILVRANVPNEESLTSCKITRARKCSLQHRFITANAVDFSFKAIGARAGFNINLTFLVGAPSP